MFGPRICSTVAVFLTFSDIFRKGVRILSFQVAWDPYDRRKGGGTSSPRD